MNNIAFAQNPEAAKAFIVENQIAGRKFEIEDLTPTLEAAARVAAIGWISPSPTYWANSFMADMRLRAGSKKGLSVGQAKGVLNVIRAEATPKAPKSVVATGPIAGANISKVRTARFRVVAPDGNSIALRISIPTMWTDAPKGTRKISARGADGWDTVGKADPNGTVSLFKKIGPVMTGRVADALETLQNADDDLVYILAYAMEGSECGFCGLELDTVESLTVGYGPTCAKKHDLPWGAKAVPAKVLLAKEGLAPSTPATITVAQAAAAIDQAQTANPAPVATSTVADVIGKLEAEVATLKAAMVEAADDDEKWDTAFAKLASAKLALKAAKAGAPIDADGQVVTPAGVTLRPVGQA